MDKTVGEAIEYVVNTDIATMKANLTITKEMLKLVNDAFWKEFKAIPDDFRWDSYRNRLVFPDRDYSQDKKDLYDRYWQVAIKCKEIKENIRNTGSGSAEDIFKLMVNRMANNIEWNSPYGWGDKHRKK